MRRAIAALAFLAATASLSQNLGTAGMEPLQAPGAASPQAPAIPEKLAPGSSRCPLEMNVQREGSAETKWLVSLEDRNLPTKLAETRPSGLGMHVVVKDGLGVHVDVQSPKRKALSNVRLALYFRTPPEGVMPVPDDPGQLNARSMSMHHKTFELWASGGATPLLAADLLAGPRAILEYVRLLSVTYANGDTWHELPGSPCNIPVSGLMRIESR